MAYKVSYKVVSEQGEQLKKTAKDFDNYVNQLNQIVSKLGNDELLQSVREDLKKFQKQLEEERTVFNLAGQVISDVIQSYTGAEKKSVQKVDKAKAHSRDFYKRPVVVASAGGGAAAGAGAAASASASAGASASVNVSGGGNTSVNYTNVESTVVNQTNVYVNNAAPSTGTPVSSSPVSGEFDTSGITPGIGSVTSDIASGGGASNMASGIAAAAVGAATAAAAGGTAATYLKSKKENENADESEEVAQTT
ncbi:hypothetical protein [Butyrivibrio sp. AE3006]|uniref:hypothetical protein n=1 Tax=Butyrivibrio sp. AE3006 TaxID=1280673 RepID=UPI0004258660|nr:hypothetical protein [Butyrivibrio sp. AE3006]